MRMPRPATTNARTGATIAGIITLPTTPSPMIASAPLAANADPVRPPMRAWDELEGSPKYHVARFQAMAPINPANTISGVTRSGCTTSLATVAATSSEMKAPTKLRIDAYVTAIRGGIARVEIDVATTFAVS